MSFTFYCTECKKTTKTCLYETNRCLNSYCLAYKRFKGFTHEERVRKLEAHKMTQPTQTPLTSSHTAMLIAITEGKKIQILNSLNEWEDCTPRKALYFLSEGNKYTLRIKPEIKTGWITIYPSSIPGHIANVGDIYATKELALASASARVEAIIQISYSPNEGVE